MVLHALGGSRVPKLLLERVRTPQSRWADDGSEVGLDHELVRILLSENYLEDLIDHIGSALTSTCCDGCCTYSIREDVYAAISTCPLVKEQR